MFFWVCRTSSLFLLPDFFFFFFKIEDRRREIREGSLANEIQGRKCSIQWKNLTISLET